MMRDDDLRRRHGSDCNADGTLQRTGGSNSAPPPSQQRRRRPPLPVLVACSVAYSLAATVVLSVYFKRTDEKEEEKLAITTTRSLFGQEAGVESDDCVPSHEWQTRLPYSTCNMFHELSPMEISLLGAGGARQAFLVTSGGKKTVLKSPKYTKFGNKELWKDQRIDGVVLERASASPFVPDIYGYCGLNVMMELGEGGSIHDYLKGSRYNNGENDQQLSYLDRLKVGYQISSGVAALHELDGPDSPPSFAHNDICCHQYLFFNGTYKVNDFDNAKMIFRDRATQQVCKEKSHMKLWEGRAPEEMGYRSGRRSPLVSTAKADVYMMGNVMYYVLTNRYIYDAEELGALSESEYARRLRRGERSPFPLDIRTSADPSVVALKQAILLCWEHEPDKRPSAREVTSYLARELSKLDEEFSRSGEAKIVLPKRVFLNDESDY